jgi:hypothetical protein
MGVTVQVTPSVLHQHFLDGPVVLCLNGAIISGTIEVCYVGLVHIGAHDAGFDRWMGSPRFHEHS